jgi:hypothetical protein
MIERLAVAVALVFTVLVVTSTPSAAVTLQVSDGDLVRAFDVNVDGTLYGDPS